MEAHVRSLKESLSSMAVVIIGKLKCLTKTHLSESPIGVSETYPEREKTPNLRFATELHSPNTKNFSESKRGYVPFAENLKLTRVESILA